MSSYIGAQSLFAVGFKFDLLEVDCHPLIVYQGGNGLRLIEAKIVWN